jgi:hypothetical protein
MRGKKKEMIELNGRYITIEKIQTKRIHSLTHRVHNFKQTNLKYVTLPNVS